MSPTELTVLVLAFIVGTVATGRVVRLLTQDSFPPIEWLRVRWVAYTGEKWGLLAECPWCAAPYVAAANVTWAWLSDLSTAWWIANLIAAVAYLAAIIVIHDEG